VIAAIVERLIDFLKPLYDSFGYLIVGGGVLLERSMFVGLIVPGDIILALGGVYASQGRLNVVAVAALGTVAAIVGESTGYWLGRKVGLRLIRKLPYLNRFENRLEDAERYFERRGGWTVAVGRYATAAGAFIPFVAGLSKMPYGRFLLFDIPAIVVWAVAITWFGYAFGNHIEFVDKALSRFGYGMLALLVAFFVGRWLWKRSRKAKAELPDPVERPEAD
jgi:membrane protein DedA with SNARE-associated domain